MSNICTLWPEDPTPEGLKNCSECGLDKHGSRMVWGEGNPHAPILILLDNPGAREDKENIPFVCGTRQTLQRAAHEVGLSVEQLYVTYVLKRKPTRTYDKEKTREICMTHLQQQLQFIKPQLIFCLGNIAVQEFFQDSTSTVKSLRKNIYNVNGFNTLVAYHPLAVRRRPNLWSLFIEDWKLVAEYYFKNIAK